MYVMFSIVLILDGLYFERLSIGIFGSENRVFELCFVCVFFRFVVLGSVLTWS